MQGVPDNPKLRFRKPQARLELVLFDDLERLGAMAQGSARMDGGCDMEHLHDLVAITALGNK